MLITTILTFLFLLVQSPTKLSFEVASLKRSAPGGPLCNFLTHPGGRIAAVGCTLQKLIVDAYGVDDFQVQGGPAWVRVERFNLTAIPPTDSAASKSNPQDPKTRPPEDELEMIKTLLAEQFRLKVHEEIKDGPVIELVRGNKPLALVGTADPDRRPLVTFGTTGKPEHPYFMQGYNASMQVFADRIAGFLGQRVVDRTGLTGSYDFKMEYADSLDDVRGPAMSTAIQELGLRLRSGRGPTRYIVIDQVVPLGK